MLRRLINGCIDAARLRRARWRKLPMTDWRIMAGRLPECALERVTRRNNHDARGR